VALFDRRKGFGEHSMDRRRTYVDIMERVLGSEILSRRPRQLNRFAREINVAGAVFTAAVTSVEVCMLDSIGDADEKR
jgi:L-alanine-DL-glutamate epimerase-like enolase superfamily enzyme